MELTIDQNCPSCGAAIVVNEDDKLIQCEFCDVSNFRIDTTAARYILPYTLPEEIHEDSVVFLPYLRFKGSVYFTESEQVRFKIVDTTRLAIDMPSLPPSLGLRPQVMKVRPVTTAAKGQFVLQTVPVKTAFLQATKLVQLFAGKNSKPILHRAFIGETISVIYQPCYLNNDNVIDAVDRRILGKSDIMPLTNLKRSASKSSWEPRFIGTLCPDCGSLLKGERDSRVLGCDNCNTYWTETKGRLKSLEWSKVEQTVKGSHYFPFWKIYFTTSGYSFSTFGGLIDFTNQPIVVSDQLKDEKLCFIIPAFKINPKKFLQIASQLTMAQSKISSGGKDEVPRKNYPVTLDKSEAIQSIKSVLAHLTVAKKKKLHNLSQIIVKVESTELVFLPFSKNVHDYMQNHTPVTIQVAAVRYGRSL